ncbi:MAG TPA: FAD-dependent oxidoreductase [Beijerinckiaceae bacterium]|nr:FAD-dependent oxidoreductase [Beijerinckiaceae bacterium]
MPQPEPSNLVTTDICIIGAGAAGLSVAATTGLLGVPTVLIERGRMGGDCLNSGCVPSKALIAAARAAHDIRTAGRFGIKAQPPIIERKRLMAHVQEVIDSIAPTDSVARYRALGVEVIEADARFVDARTVVAGERSVRARRFVIATGAGPAIPPIPGLADVPFLTNETVFALDETPRRLVIIGGGPIGVELAQAHRRLGSEVTIIEADTLLGREDPELADVIRMALRRDGVRLLEGARVTRVQAVSSGVTLDLEGQGAPEMLNASHLLVAIGRRPRLDGLGLEAAGIAFDPRGITVDAGLKTSNRRVYAIGDCAGGPQFTHVASYQAGLVVRNALFRLPVKADYAAVPRVTYTDPELAAVGLSEAQARAEQTGVMVYRWPFAEVDRARAERETAGLIKAVVSRKGVVLGAAIAGPKAGELLAPWTLAVRTGMKIGAMADAIMPYPSLSEISKRVAVQSYAAHLRNPWVGRMIRFLRRFG